MKLFMVVTNAIMYQVNYERKKSYNIKPTRGRIHNT
jgi:hypothetical protein